jgi:hypothetical protein
VLDDAGTAPDATEQIAELLAARTRDVGRRSLGRADAARLATTSGRSSADCRVVAPALTCADVVGEGGVELRTKGAVRVRPGFAYGP